MSKHDNLDDGVREHDKAQLEQVKEDDGWKPKITTWYEIRNKLGERKYLTDNKADCDQRLKELAAVMHPNEVPAFTIAEVRGIKPEDKDDDE